MNVRILRPLRIRQILETFPKGLEKTYERLLNRIETDEQPEIALALKWLTLAQRPLYIEEVIEGSFLDLQKQPAVQRNPRLSASNLTSCLTGLISIVPPLSI